MKCPECDSPLATSLRGAETCGECNTPLWIERIKLSKGKHTLVVRSLERPYQKYYEPKGDKPTEIHHHLIRREEPSEAPIKHEECIGCRGDISALQSSIRGRILRGYLVKERKKMTLRDHPGDSKPAPIFANGRMCVLCSPKYKISSGKPTVIGVIQLLRDPQPIPKRELVTTGIVEIEDALEKLHQEANAQDQRVSHVGKVKITLPTTKFRHKTITECSRCPDHNGSHIPRCSKCNAPTEQVVEQVDTNAFRRFMMTRKGGQRSYDKEVNFENIK